MCELSPYERHLPVTLNTIYLFEKTLEIKEQQKLSDAGRGERVPPWNLQVEHGPTDSFLLHPLPLGLWMTKHLLLQGARSVVLYHDSP